MLKTLAWNFVRLIHRVFSKCIMILCSPSRHKILPNLARETRPWRTWWTYAWYVKFKYPRSVNLYRHYALLVGRLCSIFEKLLKNCGITEKIFRTVLLIKAFKNLENRKSFYLQLGNDKKVTQAHFQPSVSHRQHVLYNNDTLLQFHIRVKFISVQISSGLSDSKISGKYKISSRPIIGGTERLYTKHSSVYVCGLQFKTFEVWKLVKRKFFSNI